MVLKLTSTVPLNLTSIYFRMIALGIAAAALGVWLINLFISTFKAVLEIHAIFMRIQFRDPNLKNLSCDSKELSLFNEL